MVTERIAIPKREIEKSVSEKLASTPAQLGLACANGFGAYACFRALRKAKVPPIYIVSGTVLSIFAGYHLYKTVSPKKFLY